MYQEEVQSRTMDRAMLYVARVKQSLTGHVEMFSEFVMTRRGICLSN